MPNRPSKSSKKLNSTSILLFLVFSLSVTSLVFGSEKQASVVAEVLTGDTVRLEGGRVLRYVGFYAPPLQSRIPLVRTYGENALSFNKQLVLGKKIQIEWGPQILNDQNDLLGYVFLEDGTFVNLEILKAGHGRWVNTAPNLKYSSAFRKAELSARRDKKGLWKEEPQNPFLHQEYIGHKSTKTYYFPTSPELDRIPQSQWITFRSAVEAKAAGYKPCFTCREEKSMYDY